MARTDSPKTAVSSQSKSKHGKRSLEHVQKGVSAPSRASKRKKGNNNGNSSSASQHTSADPNPAQDCSEDPSTGAKAIDSAWEDAYNITTMSIISSSHIQQKVTRAIEVLATNPTIPPHPKPKILKLYAKAPVASKMITVVEIVKRELEKRSEEWLQYNVVGQVMAERKEDVKKMGKEKDGADEEEEDGGESEEETTAFETMKTPFERANEGNEKVRAVPVMTIYLSRNRIERLRKAYG
jgi:hypothetical protein